MLRRQLPRIIAALMGVAIIVIGTRFLITPEAAAANYGVEAGGDVAAYLAAKGVRDIASGLVGLLLLAMRLDRGVGLFLLGTALIPLGDAVIVLTHGGAMIAALGIHATTAAALIAVGAWLLHNSRQSSAAPQP